MSQNISDVPVNSQEENSIFKPKRRIHFLPLLGISIMALVAVATVMGLMWQSNSFIAMNQDVRSDASSGGVQTAQVIRSSQISVRDQRFGVGGDCEIAKEMWAPWTFNWGGWWTGVMNGPEIDDCALPSNGAMKVLLTVGHADAWDKTNGIDDSQNDNIYFDVLKDAESRLSEVEGADYRQLKALLNKRPAVYNSIKIRASFLQIPQMARRYPNAYWQIANEPDWMPYFKPEDFAKYYTYFYRQIRRFDKVSRSRYI